MVPDNIRTAFQDQVEKQHQFLGKQQILLWIVEDVADLQEVEGDEADQRGSRQLYEEGDVHLLEGYLVSWQIAQSLFLNDLVSHIGLLLQTDHCS